jgi:hypothetical protein
MSRDRDEFNLVDDNNVFFPTPIATHGQNPSITSVCQVPSHKTFQCLTFEKVLIFSPFLAAIHQYQGYQFATARPFNPQAFPVAFVDNNKFDSKFSFASTWPNFLVYAPTLLVGIDFLGILIFRETPFDLVSLTIASDISNITVNFATVFNGGNSITYQVGDIGNTPSLVILNLNNITNFFIYTSATATLGVDSIVISR